MIIRISQAMCIATMTVGPAMYAHADDGHTRSPLPTELVDAAEQTLKRATTFFREHIAVEGSYAWGVSADMTFRRGEAETDDRQGWVQPPGTPSVGLVYVAAYEVTGDPYYKEAALSAGHALADTQLLSGGWHPLMEFEPERRKAWCYRREVTTCAAEGPRLDNHDRNASILDDDITQSAIRLLIVLDALDRDTPIISDAASYGLENLSKSQYPNGAWPVNMDKRVGSDKRKAKVGDRARYPASWSRTYVEPSESEFFSLNDHLMSNVIRTMLIAHQYYGDDHFLQTAKLAGDFLLAAQMPPPQSGWAHLYNSAMEPIWGRKFEPPALASWETASTIDTLIDLYHDTGLERYWDALEPAVRWLESVRIGDNLWARFYELETDKPLYMTTDYELTYDDDDLPKHYGFQDDFGISAVLETYRALREAKENGRTPLAEPLAPDPDLEAEVVRIVETLDDQGRWLEDDMIRSATFVDHVDTLVKALASASGRRHASDRSLLPAAWPR